ncbi:MAG: hypothetical protein Q4P08_05870 [Eubacteriales bacterium]|nr:hypothetical protein [Eubacteriales bacterium]
MNVAIIDIGSNTIRLNLYQVKDGDYNLLLTKKHTVGLASYVKDKRLSRKGINRLADILKRLKKLLSNVKVDKSYVFATASLRNVTNGSEVAELMQTITGLKIEIVSEAEEARLGNLAIRHNYGKTEGMTVDIGGGSTEIVAFNGDEVEMIPINEGSLSLHLNYVKGIFPSNKERKRMRKAIREIIPEIPTDDMLLAIGGTARAAGKIIAELYAQRKEEYNTAQLREVIKRLVDQESEAVQALLRVAPERVHTIVPGMIMLKEIAKKHEAKTIFVFTEGVREGFLIDKMQGELNGADLSTKS